MWPLAFGCAAALLLFAATPALAGGFVHPDNGPEGMGRGGAMTASVDNASALYFNPANLAEIDGLSVFLAANFSFLDVEFTRAGTDRRLEPDENGEIPANPAFGERVNEPFETIGRDCEKPDLCTPAGFVAPMLFIGYGGDDWGAAIGAYAPPGLGAADYPEDGPQRYALIRQAQSLIWIAAGGAYQAGPVRFGGTLLVGRLNILVRLMVDANPTPRISETSSRGYRGEESDSYSQAFDLPFQLEATGWSAAGIVGAAWDIIPELTLALSVQTQTNFDADGTLEIEFTDAIPPELATLSDDRVTLSVDQPWFVKLGLMWSYPNKEEALFDLELDVVYESWSQIQEIVLEVKGGLGSGDSITPIGNITLPKRWKDVVSIRLGGDVQPVDWWTGRLGTFFESAAVPEETTSLDNFSYDRVGVSVGSTFHTPIGLDIAVAYAHIFQPERTVENSDVRVTIPLSQCTAPYDSEAACPVAGEPPGATVANGTYDADFDFWSAALIYHFN